MHINITVKIMYTALHSPLSCKCYKTGCETDKAKELSALQLPDSGKRIELVITSVNTKE
jgi:hypothetical protein